MYADINYSVCDFQSLVINYTLQAQKDFQTLLIQGFFFRQQHRGLSSVDQVNTINGR